MYKFVHFHTYSEYGGVNMSEKRNNVELYDESLEKVDGGLQINNLVADAGKKELEVKKMPTGGRTFTVKSALATGETIAVPMDTDAKENKTGKRLPKIVFNKEGTSI